MRSMAEKAQEFTGILTEPRLKAASPGNWSEENVGHTSRMLYFLAHLKQEQRQSSTKVLDHLPFPRPAVVLAVAKHAMNHKKHFSFMGGGERRRREEKKNF